MKGPISDPSTIEVNEGVQSWMNGSKGEDCEDEGEAGWLVKGGFGGSPGAGGDKGVCQHGIVSPFDTSRSFLPFASGVHHGPDATERYLVNDGGTA